MLSFLGTLMDDRLCFKNHDSSLQKRVSMATGMLYRVSKMIPVEVKLRAYYALLYTKLINGILSWGKRSYGNKVTLDMIIKRVWRAISYEKLDSCKCLLKFESMYSYFIGMKFNRIMRLD